MSVYAFKFHVFENITKVGPSIGRTFGAMGMKAGAFGASVNATQRPVEGLLGDLKRLGQTLSKTWDASPVRRHTAEVKRARDEYGRFQKTKTGPAASLPSTSITPSGSMGGGLLKAAAGLGTTLGLVSLGQSVVNTLAEFEKFEAVLTNTLGSNSAAKTALDGITRFAASTPFQVDELTGSFVKLANRGFVPTINQMSLLGDLAASQGKGFDQLTEAVLDAQTGEFERLKEFGIQASKSGDAVTVSFKDQQRTVANTPNAIKDALLDIARTAPGVAGSMAAISKTTGGQLSNLQDQFTGLKLSIGRALQPFISNWLPKIMGGVQWMTDWVGAHSGQIMAVFDSVGAGIGTIFVKVQPLFAPLGRLWDSAVRLGTALYPVVSAIGDAVQGFVVPAFNILAGLLSGLFDWLSNVFEQNRGTILKMVGGIGLFLKAVGGFAIVVGNVISGVFKWLWDRFGGFITFMKDLLFGLVGWLWDNVISKILGFFSTIFEAVGKEVYVPKQAGAQSLVDTDHADPESIRETPGQKGGKMPFDALSRLGSNIGKVGVGERLDSVSGDRGGIKNYTINIGKQVENIVFQTTKDLGDIESKVRQVVERVMLDAVNDTNYAT